MNCSQWVSVFMKILGHKLQNWHQCYWISLDRKIFHHFPLIFALSYFYIFSKLKELEAERAWGKHIADIVKVKNYHWLVKLKGRILVNLKKKKFFYAYLPGNYLKKWSNSVFPFESFFDKLFFVNIWFLQKKIK